MFPDFEALARAIHRLRTIKGLPVFEDATHRRIRDVERRKKAVKTAARRKHAKAEAKRRLARTPKSKR